MKINFIIIFFSGIFFLPASSDIFAQSDNCATATPITLSGGTACVNGTTLNATTNNIMYGSCNSSPVNEVWYTFVTNGPTNTFTITPSGLTNAEIIIDADGCTNSSFETCQAVSGTTTLTQNWGLPAGSQVWVGIATNGGTQGGFQLCINSTNPPPGGGNACSGAIPLCNKNSFTQSSMAGFSASGQKPGCFGSSPQKDVWYTFTITQSGTLEWTATMSGTAEFDWALWNVTNGCPGTQVSCNYNYNLGNSGSIGMQNGPGACSGEFCDPINVTAGQVYAIQIDNYSGNNVGFNFTWGGTAEISPNAAFTISPLGVQCASSVNVTINNTSVGVPTWDYGDGSPTYTGSSPPAHTYSSTGTYAITASIGGACPSTAVQYVYLYGPLSATSSFTPLGCGGSCNGTASALPTGGSGTYSYIWNTGAITPTITGLCSGTYTVTVTDTVCNNSVITSSTIPAGSSIVASISKTDVLCNGACTGTLTASATGGTTPYTFSWNNGLGNGGNKTNVCAGNYTVTVTDNSGCTGTASVTVTEPATALSVTTNCSNESLPGANDGSSTSSPSGGTSPYTFLWSNTQTTQNISGLTANTYTVTVTDANNCTATSSCAVNSGSCNLTATNTTVNITCNGANNGSANINASGGGTPYSYTWSPNVSSTNSASNLSAGNYSVTVADASCTGTGAELVTNSDFSAGNTGFSSGYSFTTPPNGGEGQYWVATGAQVSSWNGGMSSSGDHTTGSGNLMMVNGSGTPGSNVWCQTISVAPGTTYLFSTWVSSLNGSSPAILQFSINGSTIGNTFNAPSSANIWSQFFNTWNSGSNTSATICIVNQNTTLGGNDFALDDISFKSCASSCTAITAFTITQPSSPLSVTTACTGESAFNSNDGTSSASASGGTTPYFYLWSNSQTTQNISGLAANTYSVTVTDANSCTATSSCAVASGAGCDLNLIRSTFTGAGCTELANCLSSCSIYFYNPQSLTGDNAQAFAQQYGANLVSVQSAAENSCIVNNLNSLGFGGIIWIGFNDVQNEGSFVWYDQSPIVYTNWAGGEPNQAGDEDCVQIYPNGQWNDLSCTSGGSSSVIEVNLCPVTTITPSLTTVCPGQSSTLNSSTLFGSSPYTYSWTSNPAGFTSASSNPTVSPAVTTTYFVTVTDRYGCISEASLTINGSALSVTSTYTDILCFGDNTGSASVTATGGATPYTFTWTNNVSAVDSAVNLTAGNYSVTVTDAVGCTNIQNFTITEPASAVDITLVSQSNLTCNLSGDGSITISVSGGNTAYTYQWLGNVSSGNIANNLSAGTHGVMVTDANGCSDTMSFVLTQPPFLSSSGSQTNVSCFGGNDGTASITASGGTTPYSYLWNNPSATTAATASGLSAGSYAATVTDSNGCTTTQVYTITQPADSVSLVASQQNVSCNGGSNGAASVLVSGGTPAYTYSWSNGGLTQSIVGLQAGNYDVTVSDSKNCTSSYSFIISEPATLAATVSAVDVACNSACTGSADASVSGGVTPYSYSWNSSPVQTSATATGLCAGNYSLVITDTNGCQIFANAIIAEPTAFSVVTDSINSNCHQFDGSAGVTVIGATPGYTYLWDAAANNQTTATANNLTDGNYCITVTDTMGCETSVCITVLFNPAPTAVISSNMTLCNGSCFGSASVAPSGGATPYSYLWNNSATTATIFNLCAGSYSVTVTDAVNCTVEMDTVVLEPSPVTVSLAVDDDTVCVGKSATFTATASGGSSPYSSYTWNIAGTSSVQTIQPVGDSTLTVFVTDDNGCISPTVSLTVILHAPVSVAASVSPNFICAGNSTTLSATASGGDPKPNYSLSWADIFGNAVGTTVTPPGAFPDSVQYVVTAQDLCSPDAYDTVTVFFHPDPVTQFSANKTLGCEPLTVNFTNTSSSPAGITDCQWELDGVLSSSDCNGFSQTFNPGVYSVKLSVADGNGCTSSLDKLNFIKVFPNPTADFSASPQTTNVQNMTVQFTDLSSGNGNNLAQWNWLFYDNNQSDILADSTSQNPSFNFSPAQANNALVYFLEDTGNYPVTLLVITENGCIDSITKIIRVDGVYYMNVPNAFSPNDDGINDIFYPIGVGIEPTTNYRFYIFNRWGDMVFQSSDLNKGWDGKNSKGAKVPEGVYVWRIDMEDVLGEIHKKNIGHVTLLRR